jgi:glutaredoxin
MSENNYKTFNNVYIGLVNGKIFDQNPYEEAYSICRDNQKLNKDGCRKGMALQNTMKELGVKYGVLVDNDPKVVEGCREYIKQKKMDAIVIWAGTKIQYPETPQLTYEMISNYFKNDN